MTPQQRQQLIAQYADGPAEVDKALDGFPASGLATRAFAGKWSALEIVHHLADSESISAIRIRRLIAEERAVITGYDQEAYAVRLRYNERPIEPALALFREARRATSAFLPLITDEQWTRAGWHTEGGLYTPERWLEIYAAHAHGHASQIQRLKEALKR